MQHVIDRLGGPTVVARMVGCRAPSVIEWRKRGVPAERCPAIERASEGKVLCEELRADVRWHRVADSAWPWHPDGRPLIDVTEATDAKAAQAVDGEQPAQPTAAGQVVFAAAAASADACAAAEAAVKAEREITNSALGVRQEVRDAA